MQVAAKRLFQLVGLAVMVMTMAGCPGGSVVEEGGDKGSVKDLVFDLSDIARDEAKFNEKFSGTPPGDRDKYLKMSYYPEKIDMAGSSATITVAVRVNDATQKDMGTVQWKAVKDGDAWKLSDAPLP